MVNCKKVGHDAGLQHWCRGKGCNWSDVVVQLTLGGSPWGRIVQHTVQVRGKDFCFFGCNVCCVCWAAANLEVDEVNLAFQSIPHTAQQDFHFVRWFRTTRVLANKKVNSQWNGGW
ncbi:unnamed protein product [Durusdinium trenchii]|uniref:Uncharacterized protein n=1 Tax=Durusdinium trenchii TaxID=1381693 RepID=A0ABP0IBN0_9DINO